jgi:hypothetical protein
MRTIEGGQGAPLPAAIALVDELQVWGELSAKLCAASHSVSVARYSLLTGLGHVRERHAANVSITHILINLHRLGEGSAVVQAPPAVWERVT